MNNVLDCGGRPRCGRCTRCRQLKESSRDPAERLLAQQAGPPISWGPPPSQADRRRRAADRVLEKAGIKQKPWV